MNKKSVWHLLTTRSRILRGIQNVVKLDSAELRVFIVIVTSLLPSTCKLFIFQYYSLHFSIWGVAKALTLTEAKFALTPTITSASWKLA
jgi:hypothetical protein